MEHERTLTLASRTSGDIHLRLNLGRFEEGFHLVSGLAFDIMDTSSRTAMVNFIEAWTTSIVGR